MTDARPPTDEELAEGIRTIVSALNNAIKQACQQGIKVGLDTYGNQAIWMHGSGGIRKMVTAPQIAVSISKGL
jgi:hypothetical protein